MYYLTIYFPKGILSKVYNMIIDISKVQKVVIGIENKGLKEYAFKPKCSINLMTNTCIKYIP